MIKKIGYIILISIFIVVVMLFLSTGSKIAGVMISDYTISEDGNTMTLKVGLVSSIGYIRTCKTKDDGNKKFITFYSTYGFNSSLGAKNEFEVELSPNCSEIYFYSGSDEYKLKLQKDQETNEWNEVKNK